MCTSGANGLPFSIPSVASNPYIGRNFSLIGSSLMMRDNTSQNCRLSSHARDVLSIFVWVVSMILIGEGLPACASGYTLIARSAAMAFG